MWGVRPCEVWLLTKMRLLLTLALLLHLLSTQHSASLAADAVRASHRIRAANDSSVFTGAFSVIVKSGGLFAALVFVWMTRSVCLTLLPYSPMMAYSFAFTMSASASVHGAPLVGPWTVPGAESTSRGSERAASCSNIATTQREDTEEVSTSTGHMQVHKPRKVYCSCPYPLCSFIETETET